MSSEVKTVKRGHHLARFTCWNVIKPLARPRFGKYNKRPYTPDNQKELRASLAEYEPQNINTAVWVDVDIFFNIEKEKLEIGNKFPTNIKQGDVDNLAKAVLDQLQHKDIQHIKDDKLVVGISATKQYTTGRSVAVINIYQAESNLD